MKLSDLQTGESAVIVKVSGHGGFRKRIVEMGFIKGQKVEALLNAPLHDPVKYRLMGYEVSLRHDEAALIEVLSQAELRAEDERLGHAGGGHEAQSHEPLAMQAEPLTLEDDGEDRLLRVAERKHKEINVALVGNPNCGKTSLFNYASGAHARVGNYSGVTVDATVATAHYGDYRLNLTDLPGTYSLSCYSPEELYVRRHLTKEQPDVVINVIDASNLERNLYLTTQLVDLNVRMVCALNMFDEFERRGDQANLDTLQKLIGVPMVTTSFKSGRGVDELLRTVVEVYEGENTVARHLHINYGHEIEDGIKHIQKYLKADEHIATHYSTRYLAIKLLEHDKDVADYVTEHIIGEHRTEDQRLLMAARDNAAARVLEETGVDAETAIMDAKYGFIDGALAEAGFNTGTKEDTYRTTHRIDNLLSNKYLGFPIFFLILYVMFQATFTLGQYPMDWIEAGVEWLGNWIGGAMSEGPLRSMLVDGVIGGVGSVIVFLPQILILYCFISFMEDSGYMARAAFIMDKLMHRMGLHGKSFIPLVMGFGCNVPAIMATRTIESRRSRLITMLILPFMSCSARLPIYIMIVGTFFAAQWRSTVLVSLYAIGILVAAIVSRIFASFVIKGEDTPFVMELPPYRWPTAKAIGRHTWEKGKEYLKKMGGIILVASIIVWALSYWPLPSSPRGGEDWPLSNSPRWGEDSLSACNNDTIGFAALPPTEGAGRGASMENSYLGRMGKAIEPIFAPQGFNWKLDVSLIAGVGAKEIVASTMGVLYSGDDSFGDDDAFSADTDKYTRLRQQMAADGVTPLTAYAYLLFILLYFPCLATIVAIKNETGSWRWAFFTAVYTTALAWIVSAAVVMVGGLM